MRTRSAWLLVALALLMAVGCRQRIRVTGIPPGVAVEKPPYISWDGTPTEVEISGTGVFYLQEFEKPTEDICRVGRRWYWFYKKHWFISKAWQGPWNPASKVPDNFLKIPSDHPRHRIATRHPGYKK